MSDHQRVHVQLNPSKTILQPVDRGIGFVGRLLNLWRRSARGRAAAVAISGIRATPALTKTYGSRGPV